MSDKNFFIVVPAITLPNGITVPSFEVGQYICSKSEEDLATVSDTGKPWVRINYHDAKSECEKSGFKLITELQYLAIAHDIANQAINWTGGKVGDGSIYQGIHKGNVSESQPGDYESEDLQERRWHELSNGERIYDFAGNCYSWIFDDVQGNDDGLIEKPFAKDSPSIATAAYPSMENGMGWRPTAGSDWSGEALIRGGYWYSDDDAGVFHLSGGWPDRGYDYVGFRCTK